MKSSKPHKYYGRWRPWATGTLAFAGLTGTLFALSEVLENDSDGDGWTDAEEIVAGTNPADEAKPWDSDVFMKHWMLRYWNGLKMRLSVFNPHHQ